MEQPLRIRTNTLESSILLKPILAAAALGLSLNCVAQGGGDANAFPARPVTIIVPYPPGGGVDVLIRAVARELSLKWKQPVVIENRGGAGGIIGTRDVAKAKPNGETLLATVDTPLTANRFLYNSLPYNPDKDLAPVIMMTRNYNFVLATASFPANNLKELIAAAKLGHQTLNYGSYGPGSHPHLVLATLASREHLDLVHVPYKGVAAMTTALISNEVPLATGTVATAGELMKAGKIKALAYAGPTRSVYFPNVPTAAEQGFPYLISPIWMALFAPAGTPQSTIDKINADVRAILTNSEFAQKNVTAVGQQVVASSPAELQKAVREDSARTEEMVRATGLKPE